MSQTKNLEILWAAVFGEPPCIKAEAGVLVQILVEALPAAPPYRARCSGGEVDEAIYLSAAKA